MRDGVLILLICVSTHTLLLQVFARHLGEAWAKSGLSVGQKGLRPGQCCWKGREVMMAVMMQELHRLREHPRSYKRRHRG